MIAALAEVDGLLRARGRYAVDRARVPLEHLAFLLALCGFLHGCTMGIFAGRPLQSLYSGLKVPMLLACSTAVCMPSFFVLNTLLGLRDDFAAAARAVLAAQATVAITLLSLAPLVALVYLWSESYRFAIFANGVVFALATLAGQRTMNRTTARWSAPTAGTSWGAGCGSCCTSSSPSSSPGRCAPSSARPTCRRPSSARRPGATPTS